MYTLTIRQDVSKPRFITNIRYDGEEEAQCIRISHPSRLYITDDFIPTHNTYLPASEETFHQDPHDYEDLPEGESPSFRKAEKAYGGQAAYDKAKAAGRTKLNYRQWVQVRTPEFKKWFGDWEGLRAKSALEEMAAVPLDDDSLAGLSAEDLRKEVSSRYDSFKKSPVTTKDGREVRFSRVGLRETKHHSADRKILELLAKVDEILPKAVPLWSEAHEQENSMDSIRAWHYYGAKTQLNGEEYLARLVVREDVNGNIYYDADMTTLEKIAGDGAPRNKSGTSSKSGDAHNIAQWYANVNPDSVSKITDEETGEPKVMYHGTMTGNFSEFDTRGKGKTEGTGAWFAEEIPHAVTYSGRGDFLTKEQLEDAKDGEYTEEGIYPVFLNLRTPMTYDFAGNDWQEGMKEIVALDEDEDVVDYLYSKEEADAYREENPTHTVEERNTEISTNEYAREAREYGADGAIFFNVVDEGHFGRGYLVPSSSTVVFNPEQIKSATENNGDFSEKMDDIFYRENEGETNAGLDAAGIQEALSSAFGKKAFARLKENGIVRVVTPAQAAGIAGEERARGAGGFMKDGVLYLVAGNVAEETLRGAALHEAVHAALTSKDANGDIRYRKLMNRLKLMRGALAKTEWFQKAEARIGAADRRNEARSLHELAAYAVEEYENAPRSVPMQVVKWVRDLLAYMKTAIAERLGVEYAPTAADLSAIARRYLSAQAQRQTQGTREENAAMASERKNPFQPDPYDARKFAEAVERIAAMKDAPHTTLTIGDTPAALRAAGANARSMQVAPSVIHKAMRPEIKGHDVPLEVMKNLPALLADPIAVFSSQTEENALVAFVEAKDGSGRSVVAAVHMDARREFTKVNKVASVYGRPAQDFIKWANAGRTKYLNKEKASEWLRTNRLQLPEVNTIERLGKNTITKEDIVNGGILYSIPAANTVRQSLKNMKDKTSEAVNDTLDALERKLQDKYADLGNLYETLREQGKTIHDSLDAYLQETLYHGRVANQVDNFTKDELRPLLEEIQKENADLGDFEEFLWMRHAKERNAQIANINPNFPDGGIPRR
ncbi:MAG: hypothetical protein LBG69_00625 [Zoogloeaceae bacterium]|jgi:hypothetical protein|nr:hypothetical protein [Zoogloeaceae bacterium]